MEALARALVNAMAFIELSGEDVIDFDSSIAAMQMLISDLQDANPQEIEALDRALKAEYEAQKSSGATEDNLEFYRDFFINTGLKEE